ATLAALARHLEVSQPVELMQDECQSQNHRCSHVLCYDSCESSPFGTEILPGWPSCQVEYQCRDAAPPDRCHLSSQFRRSPNRLHVISRAGLFQSANHL